MIRNAFEQIKAAQRIEFACWFFLFGDDFSFNIRADIEFPDTFFRLPLWMVIIWKYFFFCLFNIFWLRSISVQFVWRCYIAPVCWGETARWKCIEFARRISWKYDYHNNESQSYIHIFSLFSIRPMKKHGTNAKWKNNCNRKAMKFERKLRHTWIKHSVSSF